MNFIYGVLSDRIINALGWTILHSLWQVLIIGILLFLFLYFYRNHNSVIRYNLSVFSLGLIFGLSILTFIFYFKDTGQTESITDRGILVPRNNNGIVISVTSSVVPASGIIGSIQSIIHAISLRFPILITLWLTGVLIISVYMTGGIYLTQRLRKSCLYEIPEELHKRFLDLWSRMNIHKRVNIHGSSLIAVPSVVGYLKPVILLPICMVTQMPLEQLESILAHELAHIRRNDYLVNLFQSFLEALFFYHPVVWMIQKRIRRERENCCDDLALSYAQGQITYIKALTSIQEIPGISGFPVLAMGSDRHFLLSRIVRILKKEKMKPNLRDKLFAGIILASAIVIILLNTGGKFISFNSIPDVTTLRDQHVQISNKPPQAEMADLIPQISKIDPSVPGAVVPPCPEFDRDTSFCVKDNVIHRTLIKDGKEMDFKMKVEKGEITELYVDGKKIPESDYNKYQTEIDKTMVDVKKLERELSESNQKLNQFENQYEMDEIRREMEETMREIEEELKEIDIEAMVEEIEIPDIDQEKISQEIQHAIQEIETIDMEKIRQEMEFAMQSLCEELKNIEVPDMNELKMEMEKALQELTEIDQEEIQKEIQESMGEIQIDKEEIQRVIEKSLQEIKEIDMEEIRREIENERINMEEERINMEKERVEMNEMLEEIEKLELESN